MSHVLSVTPLPLNTSREKDTDYCFSSGLRIQRLAWDDCCSHVVKRTIINERLHKEPDKDLALCCNIVRWVLDGLRHRRLGMLAVLFSPD
jgi:hypothetical protein